MRARRLCGHKGATQPTSALLQGLPSSHLPGSPDEPSRLIGPGDNELVWLGVPWAGASTPSISGLNCGSAFSLASKPAPVVIGRPVAGELGGCRQLHALRPVRDEFPAGPACRGDAPPQAVDRFIRHVDTERTDSVPLDTGSSSLPGSADDGGRPGGAAPSGGSRPRTHRRLRPRRTASASRIGQVHRARDTPWPGPWSASLAQTLVCARAATWRGPARRQAAAVRPPPSGYLMPSV
jgi:hypothetical protein